MELRIACVVEAREKAVLLRLAIFNQPVVWLPRRAIQFGEYLHAGETDFEADLETWAYQEVMQAIAKAKNMRDGSRVIDGQKELWNGC